MAERLTTDLLRIYRRLEPAQRECIRRVREINNKLEAGEIEPAEIDLPLHFPSSSELDAAE